MPSEQIAEELMALKAISSLCFPSKRLGSLRNKTEEKLLEILLSMSVT
jgi:hypothetical protein